MHKQKEKKKAIFFPLSSVHSFLQWKSDSTSFNCSARQYTEEKKKIYVDIVHEAMACCDVEWMY